MLEADTSDEKKNQLLEEFKISGNNKKILQELDGRYKIEKKLVSQYKSDNDYLKCFMSLPKTLRNIYMHSYQSYLWNNAVNMRI